MWWWTVQNLVVTAILTGLVWVVCRLLGIGPAARHALWLVVLLKMLTPPLVAWPWAVGDGQWLWPDDRHRAASARAGRIRAGSVSDGSAASAIPGQKRIL